MEEIKGFGGVRFASLVVFIFLFMIYAALAADFSTDTNPGTFEATESDVELNFTINNTNSTYNITQVNITIPSGFVYVDSSNKTSTTPALVNFTNGSSYITWENETDEGFVLLSDTEWFNASFSASTAPGNYTFNISVVHTNGEMNYTYLNATVEDTTTPAAIERVSPGIENESYTNLDWFYVNVTFTEFNPDTCLLDLDNGTQENYTMTNIGNYACYFNATGQGQGNWNYSIWLNDTSGNMGWNGTWFAGVDTTDPMGNSLGLFYQGGDVSGGNITELGDVIISVNVTDALSGINTTLVGAVYANVTNSSGDMIAIVNLSYTSGNIFNGTWDADTYSAGGDNYSVNVTATDIAGNTNVSAIYTDLEIVGAPELFTAFSGWTSDNTNTGWPHYGNNLTLNVTIFNDGEENFLGNVSVRLNISNREIASVNVSNESLEFGENYTVQFLVLSSGNFTSNTVYTFYAEVDPESAVLESSETNNTDSFSIKLGYNVSMVSVDNGSVVSNYPEISNVFPNRSMTMNISVKFANGDPVTGLIAGNFSFSHTPPEKAQEDDTALDSRGAISYFSNLGDGYYRFNFSTHDLYGEEEDDNNGYNRTRADPRLSDIGVSVSNSSYYGSTSFEYNLTAPDLVLSIEIDDIVRTSDDTVNFSLKITNEGNSPAYNIRIDEDNWEFGSVFDDFDQDPEPTKTISLLNPNEEYVFGVGDGEDLEITAIADQSSVKNMFVFVYYNDSLGKEYKGFDYDKAKITSSSSEEEDDDDTTTGGGGEDTLDLELSIMDWDDEIDVYPGGSNTTRVEVKNTGDVTVVSKVSFSCEVIEDTTIAPISKSLGVGLRQEFIIEFDIYEDAEIGEYDCTVKAYVSSSEDDYDDETIVIKVQATEEDVVEIEGLYDNLTVVVGGLLNRFRLVNPGLVNDTNLTNVENLMKNANSTLNSIGEAIEDGDYITAHDLIESLNASLANLESSLSELELEQRTGGGFVFSGTWFWAIIIIVVVIAVAFVAYLLFPQKGYGPKRGIMDNLKDTIGGGGEKVGQIKDKGEGLLSRKKAPFRPSSYGGYDKQASAGYAYRKGPADKIKGALSKIKEKFKRKKKPQKEVTQYFKNPSSKMVNF